MEEDRGMKGIRRGKGKHRNRLRGKGAKACGGKKGRKEGVKGIKGMKKKKGQSSLCVLCVEGSIIFSGVITTNTPAGITTTLAITPVLLRPLPAAACPATIMNTIPLNISPQCPRSVSTRNTQNIFP